MSQGCQSFGARSLVNWIWRYLEWDMYVYWGEGQWLVCHVYQNRYVHLSPHTDFLEALSKFSCFSLDSFLNTKVIASFYNVAYLKNLEVQRTILLRAVVLESQYIYYWLSLLDPLKIIHKIKVNDGQSITIISKEIFGEWVYRYCYDTLWHSWARSTHLQWLALLTNHTLPPYKTCCLKEQAEQNTTSHRRFLGVRILVNRQHMKREK